MFCDNTRGPDAWAGLQRGRGRPRGRRGRGEGSGARNEAEAGRRRRDGEVVGVRRGVAEGGGKATAARSRKHPREQGELNQNLTLL